MGWVSTRHFIKTLIRFMEERMQQPVINIIILSKFLRAMTVIYDFFVFDKFVWFI